MANVAVTGARGTLNITQAQRKVDMASRILLLEPDAAPLVVLSSRIGSKPTHNPKFSWMEDSLIQRFDATTAGVTNVATTVPVGVGANFAQHDLVKNTRTGEVFRVDAVATNDLTVVRGVGASGTGIAMNNADELLVIGAAQPEGDTSKPARSANPTEVYNYTQITKTPYEATETLRHSDTYTEPDEWTYNANKAGIEHKKSLEYTRWHGKPDENTAGSQPRRTAGGVFHYATSNNSDAGGGFTEAEFFAALRTPFRYGSGSKVMFGSALVVDVLNTFPRGKMDLVQADNDKTYGLNVRRFMSPHGTVNLITHWLLEGTYYGGYLVVLDMSVIRKRHLANKRGSRDTQIERGIQANDADTEKDQYLTEDSMEFGNKEMHAVVTNITSAA